MAEEKKVKKKQIKQKGKKRGIVSRVVFVVLAVLLIAGIGVGIKLGITLIEMKGEAVELVSTATRDTFKANQTTLVYDTNGELITKLKGEKDVYYLEYDEIPQKVVEAVIAVEDTRFYEHNGIDLKGITRAAVSLIKNKGEIHEGASTITQQLARGIFLNNEVTWTRKIKEMFVALELEKIYSKEDILEFYLNNIYYSNGYYGIQAASQGYFNKDADELTLSQIAYLSAIPNGPTMYNPYNHPDATTKRRNKILKDMLEEGYISQSEYDEAVAEEITVVEKKTTETHDYVETYVIHCATESLMKDSGFEFQYSFKDDDERDVYEEEYNKAYATCKHTLYTAGYRIYTSIDFDKQEALQDAIDDRLSYFSDKDNGVYEVQAAGTCIDNETGKVAAIVGGRSQDDLEGYTLNRAYQSARQPGSSIKPLLVYAPALERGYTPGSTVNDSPMSSSDSHKVSNSGSYGGNISLRAAVMKSSNVATMRLYESLTPKTALSYLEKMEFSHLVDRDYQYYTTCLGGMTYGTTTEEMAAGFATLANDGKFSSPTCIEEITDASGNLVVKGSSGSKKVYSESAAKMMTDVLESVVTGGTGKGTKIQGFDTAGKTGTTSDYRDGWFCGYTPYYTTAIWVGRDDHKVMGNLHGNTYPAYIWKDFMSEIHEGLDSEENFENYDGGEAAVTSATQKTEASSTTASDTATTSSETTTEASTTEAMTTETPTTAAPTTEQQPSNEPSEEENN
ncbi:MAG: PBP1A family penicillin-binding protein [Lachnospiraceae bacterium]|nr:PBP1A family penicillin-binding protein [Lachnospiraceae bacterium]